MAAIILRRLVNLVIILFVVGTVLFFMVRMIPGDPAVAILGADARPAQLEQLRDALGISGPVYQQYLGWFAHIFQGDFGQSITYHKPVLEVILHRLPPTLTLAVVSTVLALIFSILITVWTVSRPRNPVARFVNQAVQLGLALPDFWLALVLIVVVALELRLVPTSGWTQPFWSDPVTAVQQMILPVAVLMVGMCAGFVIILREGMLGQMSQQYLRTARVKGLTEFQVARKHALTNAVLPLLTVVGLNFAALIGGIVILESIFVIPGMGSMMLQAITARDFMLLQGGALFAALLFVVVNLITDLVLAAIDPKVRVA